jgi:aminoglycoside phosphotransferase (APT) family kinase protein
MAEGVHTAVRSPSGDGPDAAWIHEHLASRIWRDDEAPGRVVDVRIRQRRQSEKGTTLFCAVDLRGSDGAVVEQLYLLRQVPADLLQAEAASVAARATVMPALGRAVTVIPEAGTLLVAFPNDPHMRLVTDGWLREWLDGHASELVQRGQEGPRWRLGESTVEVLRYAPGQRLTLRCRGRFVAAGGEERPFGFIAKQFRRAKWARTLHENLVGIAGHLRADGTALLPRPVAFDEEAGLVVMEELPGTDLKRALAVVDLGSTMEAAGAVLAAFHQVPHRVSESVTVLEELEEVRDSARQIEQLYAAAGPRLSRCLARCLSARWTDEVPVALLHGAYRPKHVWVHDGRLAVIDVDGIRMGHPAYDLGHFLSALYYLELQGHLSPAARRAAARRFLAGYSARAPWRLQPAAVLWFVAALLLHKQARKFITHQDDDREDKVDRVLRLAERALEVCEGLPPGAPLEAVWDVLDD